MEFIQKLVKWKMCRSWQFYFVYIILAVFLFIHLFEGIVRVSPDAVAVFASAHSAII